LKTGWEGIRIEKPRGWGHELHITGWQTVRWSGAMATGGRPFNAPQKRANAQWLRNEIMKRGERGFSKRCPDGLESFDVWFVLNYRLG